MNRGIDMGEAAHGKGRGGQEEAEWGKRSAEARGWQAELEGGGPRPRGLPLGAFRSCPGILLVRLYLAV